VRFSLVYPTRHRPAFIREALRFAQRQSYREFEVVVCDNYVDPSLSCEEEVRRAGMANVKYVRPPEAMGMVENWNYALRYATGDYICYFTDKMLLLPDTLERAARCIEETGSEIVTWVDGTYHPDRFPDYFGTGTYTWWADSGHEVGYTRYDPLDELSKKGRAEVARPEQDRSTYSRGKICFGAYRSDLCDRIIRRTGALFHRITPDYSSMILGLSLAGTAAEIDGPGIVHINTDLSNGGQTAVREDVALRFLDEMGDTEAMLANMLVPGLYSAGHNIVAHDYVKLKARFDLPFEFDRVNWLVYITEDLDTDGRVWSSPAVEAQQRGLLREYLEQLSADEYGRYRRKLASRGRVLRRRRLVRRTIAARNSAAKALLPDRIVDWLRARRAESKKARPQTVPSVGGVAIHYGDIGEILEGFPRSRPGGIGGSSSPLHSV
jgi:glycosyltransferase involved in cell wall biosynthesis